MENFKELLVWQKSIDFVIEIYRTTETRFLRMKSTDNITN